jgi:hypothetical protein
VAGTISPQTEQILRVCFKTSVKVVLRLRKDGGQNTRSAYSMVLVEKFFGLPSYPDLMSFVSI